MPILGGYTSTSCMNILHSQAMICIIKVSYWGAFPNSARLFCIYIIVALHIFPNFDFFSRPYFSAFLTKESTDLIQTALGIFNDTSECISLVNEIYTRIDRLVRNRDKWPENMWKLAWDELEEKIKNNIISPFPRWFARLWVFITRENVDMDDERFWIDKLTERWIKDRSPEFLRAGKAAVSYFGHDAEFVARCKIFTNPQFQDAPVIHILNLVCESLILGACLILKRLVENTSPKVAENVMLFHRCKQNVITKMED